MIEIVLAIGACYVALRLLMGARRKKAEKAKVDVLSLIEQMLLTLGNEAEKSQEYPSVWHLLVVDFATYRLAVKSKPDDRLILLFAGMLSSLALFGAAKSDKGNDKPLLMEIAQGYGVQMLPNTAALLRLHGGVIQPHEEEYARQYIASLKPVDF